MYRFVSHHLRCVQFYPIRRECNLFLSDDTTEHPYFFDGYIFFERVGCWNDDDDDDGDDDDDSDDDDNGDDDDNEDDDDNDDNDNDNNNKIITNSRIEPWII